MAPRYVSDEMEWMFVWSWLLLSDCSMPCCMCLSDPPPTPPNPHAACNPGSSTLLAGVLAHNHLRYANIGAMQFCFNITDCALVHRLCIHCSAPDHLCDILVGIASSQAIPDFAFFAVTAALTLPKSAATATMARTRTRHSLPFRPPPRVRPARPTARLPTCVANTSASKRAPRRP